MATVTGQVQVDFSGLANANPYTNANFSVISGTARIESGLWRTTDPGTLTHWRLNPSTYTFGDVIRAKIEIGPAGTTDLYDGLWALIIDGSGNGYGFRMGFGTTLTRLRFDAFVAAQVVTDSQTAANGDQLEIEYTKSTGAVRCYYNGTLRTALNLTDTTHAGLTLTAGMAQRPQNVGDGGIRSFAADGLASGGTVNTQTLTDTLVASDQAFQSMIRGAVLTDSLVLQDFLAWWCYRTRTLSDSVVVTEGATEACTEYNAQLTDQLTVSDELISNVIGYLIFVSMLTSNVTVTDQTHSQTFFTRLLDSNVLTTDQALRALWVSRELMDAVLVDDSIGTSVQRFILLTDALSLEDSLTATYIPDTGPIVDNPIIRIGFEQPEIALGGYSVN